MNPPRFRKSNIKEVAKLAGVSVTTVSQFVSGRTSVCSTATAERIRTAVATLHYTPSSLTGGLRNRSTQTIGMCIAGNWDPRVFREQPFSEALWSGITHEADSYEYSLLHFHASIRNGRSCDAFLDGRVDGMWFYNESGNDRLEKLSAAGMPVVVTVRSHDLPAGCGAVYANEEDTMELALSHLWELGHRRIAHLTGPREREPVFPGSEPGDDIAEGRFNAFVTNMQRRGAFDLVLVAPGHNWTALEEAIKTAVSGWYALSERPTAVVCANDRLARATIRAAQKLGWRVPQELSVIGIDNTDNVAPGELALTSIEVPIFDVGRMALRTIVRYIEEGVPEQAEHIRVPVTKLVVRDTTAPVGQTVRR